MKVALLLIFLATGALLGALSAGDEFGLRIVMGSIGAVVGAAIGGVLLGMGNMHLDRRETPVWGDPTWDKGARWSRGGRGRPR